MVCASSLLVVASAWTATPAFAQAQAQEPDVAPPPESFPSVPAPVAREPEPAPAPLPPPPPPPPVAAAPAPVEPSVASDLDVAARPFAVGYSGFSQVPVGGPVGDLTVPAVGIRYWVSPKMGVDAAIGIGWTGGSTEADGTSMDKDSVFGFILQGGLPLAIATGRHVSFQVIPFLTLAHGQTSVSAPSGITLPKIDYSGTRVTAGARAGLEVFFGFIGIPELALSATVGLQLDYRKVSVDMAGTSSSDSTISFTTTVQNNPWDIFTGTVSARYYF
jgi:hypothetical protein